jgi:serine/threonine protein kinase
MEISQPVTLHAPARYRFLGKLGEGGMAEVYVGVLRQTPGFRKLLVLKLLRESLADDPECLTMFLDEARLTARLNHRNVVQTYEVGQVGDRHAIVMEFLEGATLSKLRRLAQGSGVLGSLPLAAGLYVVSEALAGLHYAHDLKDFDGSPLHIVHRDFTPANVMVTLDGQVKVLDFGVAKARANRAQTHTGVIKGTTRYMARETLLGRAVDRRTDVYMAGVVLWQLVTGQRPWDDREDVGVLAAILEHRLPPVRTLDASVSAALEAIIYRATDPDPTYRHQTAQELREALLGFARQAGLSFDPDRLARLTQELAGAECQELRRGVDRQLSQTDVPTDVMLAGSVPAPSVGPESSASRIRPTSHEGTLTRLRRYPLLLTVGGLLVLCGGLAAALTLRREPPPSASTDVRLTVEVPRAESAPAPSGAAAAPAVELPRAPEPRVTELPRAEAPVASKPAARRERSKLRPVRRPKLRSVQTPAASVPARTEPAARSIDTKSPWQR